MEERTNLKTDSQDLLVRYGEEIEKACERAVRGALLIHKRAGNPIAIARNGSVVLLQPDEIEVGEE